MINRDGACVSLWQDCINHYKATPSTKKDYDVIIVGGGITGISTGLLLQESGKRCLILEAASLCFGTTGGTTAHINTLLDTPYSTIISNFGKDGARMVAQATRDAIAHIRNTIQRYRIECDFEEADAYLFAVEQTQEKELEEILEATKEVGLTAFEAKQIPVPIPFKKAIKVHEQAKFNPVRYVYALAEAFESSGGVIREGCRVTGAENNDQIKVETTEETFTCRYLVYATHVPTGVNILHLRCVPYRSYAIAVRLADGAYPADLAYDMYDPYHYYRTQEVDGEKYLIAGGEDHKTGHEKNAEVCFKKLENHLHHFFDFKEVEYQWSSQYFESSDGLPYIGHLPGQPGNIYVATGYGGNGMVYSQIAALLIKNMILNETSDLMDLFDPNRIKPVAGFKNFIKHNADVAKLFAGKLFSGEDLMQLAELAAGEARIVKYQGHKIALYKDHSGTLHAITPVCTHLRCEVKWNNAEGSWDCPCHGARYSPDGKVLTGPADQDLKTVDLMTHVALP